MLDKNLFKFGCNISQKTSTIVSVIGFIMILVLWHVLTTTEVINRKILPPPIDTVNAFVDLFITSTQGWKDLFYSIKLNLTAYVYALGISIPLGFIIGLFPLPKALFQRYTDALRFLPIPCVSGIFIACMGLGFTMKASFLAFGIILFILPSVVNHISNLQNPTNVNDYVYLSTIKTIGANNWQKFKEVYFPYTMGKVYSEIVNLTSITWTYLVISECLNKEGGIGASISTFARQSNTPAIYASLLVIILTGMLQDYSCKKLEKVLFPYKFTK